jgi:hypothetical protein
MKQQKFQYRSARATSWERSELRTGFDASLEGMRRIQLRPQRAPRLERPAVTQKLHWYWRSTLGCST